MVHNGLYLPILLPPRQRGIAQDVIDLCSGQIEHVGFDLLGKIVVLAFGEEILRFLIDFQIAVPPPGLIRFGRGSLRHAVVVKVLAFYVGERVRAIQHLGAKGSILADMNILTIGELILNEDISFDEHDTV